jgi:MFS family permease
MLVGRSVWGAVLVHILSLVAAIVILLAIIAALQGENIVPADSGSFILMLCENVTSGLLSRASGRLGGVQNVVALGAMGVIGEVFYWCFAIPVLGAWMGATVPKKRQVRLGAVLAGYASVWLVPLVGSWLAGGAFLLLALPNVRQARPSAFWSGPLPQILCYLFITVVPAGMFALALRLARGAGEAAHEPPVFEDILCEQCGYNLHATPADHLCPECGQPAAHSYSPTFRDSRWEAGQERFIRTLWRLLSNPRAFFATIRVHENPQPARRFLVLSTLLSSLLLMATIVEPLVANRATAARLRVYGFPGIGGAIGLALLLAGLWAIAVPAISMLTASMLTGLSRRQGDRLGACGSFKIACYASAVAVPWAVIVGVLVLVDIYMGFTARLRFHGGMAAADNARVLIWAILGVALLVWYWIMGSRAYEACRWANH